MPKIEPETTSNVYQIPEIKINSQANARYQPTMSKLPQSLNNQSNDNALSDFLNDKSISIDKPLVYSGIQNTQSSQNKPLGFLAQMQLKQ